MPVSLEDLLSAEEMVNARRPMAVARTLPRQAFTSPAFYDFEVEHVLRSSWMAVAFSAEIEQTGDTQPLEVLGAPILLIRNSDSDVRRSERPQQFHWSSVPQQHRQRLSKLGRHGSYALRTYGVFASHFGG
jgi:hypothetical protein